MNKGSSLSFRIFVSQKGCGAGSGTAWDNRHGYSGQFTNFHADSCLAASGRTYHPDILNSCTDQRFQFSRPFYGLCLFFRFWFWFRNWFWFRRWFGLWLRRWFWCLIVFLFAFRRIPDSDIREIFKVGEPYLDTFNQLIATFA